MRAVLLLLLALALTACDGKPCRDKPDYEEYDEEVNEVLDDLLDSADAYDHQRKRVFALHESLDDEKKVFRKKYEATRSAMIDALVAVEPSPTKFHFLIDEMHGVFMPYVYEVVDLGVKAHRWFTMEQRAALADEYDQDPEDYDGSWAINRGIDAALLKISATDDQKKLVKGWRDRMVRATDRLFKDQNEVRKKLLAEWRKKKIDPNAVRTHIDEGASQISSFMHLFGDGVMEVTLALTPKQRMWTNKQVNRMRRCKE